MFSRLLFLLCISLPCVSQVKLCFWNLCDFGKTKSDSEIVFIAAKLRGYDVIAILEVVAGFGGSQAVARLADELNRTGAKWEYRVSDPTSGNSYKKERYAFLWKPSRLYLKGEPWLEKKYHLEIDREPYFATFKINDREFTIAAYHAITRSMQPETEIKYFKLLNDEYPGKKLILLGDFNCPQSHTVFIPLRKMGYIPVLEGQKTSLKRNGVADDCLASEYDNLFFRPGEYIFLNAGVIEFHKQFGSLEAARRISDHLPVFFEFDVR